MSDRPYSDYDFLFKLLIVGDSGVGKTALLLRFTDEMFSASYVSTIGIDFKIKTIEVGGKTVKLQIWDTAGQDRFQTITAAYFRGANGVIFAYSSISLASFENLARWFKEAEEKCSKQACHLLVATKCDLDSERVIDTQDGKRCAQIHNMRFYETSAKTAENVQNVFVELTRDIMLTVAANYKNEEKQRSSIYLSTDNKPKPLISDNKSDKKGKCSC